MPVTEQIPSTYSFGPFLLDAADRRLFRNTQPIVLRAKVFDTLLALVARPSRLIAKEELLEAIWPDSIVEETNLAHNVSVLRKALGEKGYIETVPGKGYRFLAEVSKDIAARSPAIPRRTAPVSIHREAEGAVLRQAFHCAQAGKRRVVFVTAPAGLGKTCLADAFLDECGSRSALTSTGQCIDQRGECEPYLSVLDALGRLCRGTEARTVTGILARYAPAWLVRMPWLMKSRELDAPCEPGTGATRESMLREIVEALDAIAAHKPLLLVLEDLHWSDPSTLDLIDCLARRMEPARLLLLGTVRTADVSTAGHGIHRLVRDLSLRGLASEIPLDTFPLEAVEEYLDRRFSLPELTRSLARPLHERTQGVPLFVNSIVEDWIARGFVTCSGGDCRVTATQETLRARISRGMTQLIESRLDSLDEASRRMLEAAAVAGKNFSASIVSSLTGQPEDAVEDRLTALARAGAFVVEDGALTQFSFVDETLREVLRSRIPGRRRMRYHLAAGSQAPAHGAPVDISSRQSALRTRNPLCA